jgi:hypothetical protein
MVPLPMEGIEVRMTVNPPQIVECAASQPIYTQLLTSCTAVATFCKHNNRTTLTHVRTADEVLGRYLAGGKHVHDGDTIVIAFGEDTYLPRVYDNFETAKEDIGKGLKHYGVNLIHWKLDFVNHESQVLLNAQTFVVARGRYGRAARRDGPPRPRGSGGGGPSGGGPSGDIYPNQFRGGLQAGKVGGAAGGGAGGGNAGAPKKAATRGGRAK